MVSISVSVNETNATGFVELNVGGKTYYAKLDDGMAVFSLYSSPGRYMGNVRYLGDDYYKESFSFININVEDKQNTFVRVDSIVVDGNMVSISVSVNETNATGFVELNVGGKTYYAKLDDGRAVFSVYSSPGRHMGNVRYLGDDYYKESLILINFNVFGEKSNAEISIVSVKGSNITGILKDSNGNAISNATISYTIDNETANVTTDDNGKFVIPAEIEKEILIKYAGSDSINPVNITFTIKDRIETVFESEAYKTIAIDFYARERGNYFNFTLKDINGNPLVNKTVFIGFNGVTYNKTTDENGTAFLQINLMNAGTYTFAMGFLGDEKYVGAFMVQKITVTQKKTSISAAAKTYKASTKTKKYTVTLKTNKGNSIDGKTYLRSGKTIKLTVNGKTYAAKTNAKGQATFKITKLTKKGTYTAKIKFAGDKTYKASSNSVKIKVK